ncbi:MAG: DUF3737 family protein [Clostridia bacterium]|nr:DUF3737 family protein [Clostridia bacterium]
MREIKEKNFPQERALYGEENLRLIDCTFAGDEDGESALKECKNIELAGCKMELRYPLWHGENLHLDRVSMTETCRASLWYSSGISIEHSELFGIKALRECKDVELKQTEVRSPEFGWRSRNIRVEDSSVEGEYPFFEAKDLSFERVHLKGKYSFQYVENLTVENCVFDTKDAFWHAKNVVVKNSVIKGEYLCWYGENVTFLGCKIIGTQPLCYCKGLRLVDCEMEEADFAFEYSEVEADLRGRVLSVKNPRSGHISAETIDEILFTADSKYDCTCEVTIKKKPD